MSGDDSKVGVDESDLVSMAESLIGRARPGEQIEVVLGRGSSTAVKVHGGEVESLTSADTAGAGVRVISGGRQGFAHCGTVDPEVLLESLSDARDNLRFAEPDEFNSLASPDGVSIQRQNLFSDTMITFPTDDKIELALELERKVLSSDPRITSARSTSYSDGWSEMAIVSTMGIRSMERATSCSIATQPLSKSGDETQIGFGYGTWKEPSSVDVDSVAGDAVERAVRLLGARKPPSGRMTILLEPRLAMTLMAIVGGMAAGDSVVRGRSPFADRLGDQVGSTLLDLVDDPTASESMAAAEFDGEGLACRPNPILVGGVLDRFLYDSYTGRRVGMPSTASAVRGARSLPGVGTQLLVMKPGTSTGSELLGSIETGLYVNSFTGLHSGVNAVSGDFSVGGDGLMIRDGELAEPVRELTIASTIQRLLQNVVMLGADFEWLPSGSGGCSLVIEDVSISGT